MARRQAIVRSIERDIDKGLTVWEATKNAEIVYATWRNWQKKYPYLFKSASKSEEEPKISDNVAIGGTVHTARVTECKHTNGHITALDVAELFSYNVGQVVKLLFKSNEEDGPYRRAHLLTGARVLLEREIERLTGVRE